MLSRRTRRLARVIEARRKVRDQRAAVLTTAEHRVAMHKNETKTLRRDLDVLFESVAERGCQPMSASQLEAFDQQRKLWCAEVAAAEDRMVALVEDADRSRSQLAACARSLRMSEEIHAVARHEDEKRSAREEQKEADDLSAARRTR